MIEKNEVLCLCPIGGIIDIIAKKWNLLIINTIANHHKLRFKELMQELRTISPKSLTTALKQLQAAKLINRNAFNQIPPKVEYSLTSDGIELRKVIVPLLQWALVRTDKTFISYCDNSAGLVEQQEL